MRRVRRYDFVGGSVSLGVGFEVVKTQAWPSPSLSLSPSPSPTVNSRHERHVVQVAGCGFCQPHHSPDRKNSESPLGKEL